MQLVVANVAKQIVGPADLGGADDSQTIVRSGNDAASGLADVAQCHYGAIFHICGEGR